MLVIADSGPIISLAVINKLDLLPGIYGEVCISEAVWQEISRYITPSISPRYKALTTR
jgi:predicted nucleic acid-binding protein